MLERQPSGALKKVSAFDTKHALDNIEMGPGGKLTAGTIPFLYTNNAVCHEAG